MAIEFRDAVRQNASLLIGLASGTGGGKTVTAMRLAKGICGDRPFAVIDTEAGRALHYADNATWDFKFKHADLKPPFTPAAYTDAIATADQMVFPAIVVDSMSHVWAGEGGVCDMQEKAFAAKNFDEKQKIGTWIKPKGEHKRMVQKLLQVRAHLILCFRAEEKIQVMMKGGRMEVLPASGPTVREGWVSICEKNLPYELTASFLMTVDKPGYPKAIKLQEQHKPMFPLDRPIDEESGRAIAKWASGKNPMVAHLQVDPHPPDDPAEPPTEQQALITDEQVRTIRNYARDIPVDLTAFGVWLKAQWGTSDVCAIPKHAYAAVIKALDAKKAAKEKDGT